jgi:hypothetical protein
LWGRVREGGIVLHRSLGSLADDLHNAIQIREHLVVGEAKHRITLRLKPGITSLIAPLTGCEVMTLAIELDDQTRGVTNKIGDVTPNWDLPPETETTDAVGLDVTPQQSLRARHGLAKLLCAR